MNNLNLHDNNVPSNTVFNPIGYTNTLSEKTKLVYVSTILEFFNVKKLEDVTIDRIQNVDTDMANAWAVSMLEQGLKKSTINKKMCALRNFYKFLCRRSVGVMTFNPFDTDEGAIRYKNAVSAISSCKTLSPEEIQTMVFVASSKKGIEGLRNKIIMNLLWSTGMRREEIINLRIGNIQQQYDDGELCHVFSFYGKGDKLRIAGITDEVYADIMTYIEKRKLTIRDKDEPMFISHSSNSDKSKPLSDDTIYRIVKDAAKGAGLDPSNIHPHTLRHTFATITYKSGMGINELKDIMGHSSINTTNRYIHTNDTMSKAVEAADQMMNMINEKTV